MTNAPTPGALIRPLNLSHLTDEEVRRPLWDYPPAARLALIHERRRRFGVYDDDPIDE